MATKNLNLASGQPPNNLLANDIIKNATIKLFNNVNEEKLGDNSSLPLAYGDNYEYFARRIASLLETETGRENVNFERIVPIAGVSNGLDLLCTLFCRNFTKNGRRGVAFVEDYTYFLSISLFEDHGLTVVPLRTDGDGILIEEFKIILDNLKVDDNVDPLFLYCIPTFHNPTGRTMSLSRRIDLLNLTLSYSVHVIADEVYQFLGFSDYLPEKLILEPKPITQNVICTRYPSFASISPLYTHVISISSFSKILGPGLRVGWMEFTSQKLKQMFDQLGVIKSGSNICHFASYVAVTSFICPEDISSPVASPSDAGVGVDRDHSSSSIRFSERFREICPFRQNLHYLRTILASKYSTLIKSLQKYQSEYLSPQSPYFEFLIEGHPSPSFSSSSSSPSFSVVGGYFIWIYLPEWIGNSEEDGPIMTSSRLLEISRSSPYNLSFLLGTTCQKRNVKENQTQEQRVLHPTREVIRMCFARLELEELEGGAHSFCKLLKDFQPSGH